MANFLDDLSIYNAKAAAAISAAVVECNNEKANMMSSLKTTANDITLSEEIRLNALTALINLGNLLDIPLPPYFPVVTTYALTETFVGVHNDLDGIQGGAPGEYYHLTDAERTAILNKASIGDINWEQLAGVYSDNVIFGPQFDAKQDGLVAPAAGTYFVKINGTTVSYDNNVYLSTIEGITAGGELEGTYRSPTLSNAAVIGKVLTGWNGSVTGTITASDTILTALQKLNANLNAVIASPGGVASVALTNNAPLIFTTTTTPQTGAASLSLGLNTQNANLLLASPNGTNGLPLFRALAVADLPNSGVTVGTYGSSTVIPQIQVDAKGRITGVTSITAASGGQVNTVGLSVPGILSPSFVNAGTPSDPIITLALDVQPANYVWAGPQTGADAVPFFRPLVVDDIPQLPITKIDGLDAFTGDFLSDSLGTSLMYIGNGSNKAVQAEVAGDIEALYDLINTTQTAVLTIKDEAVTYAKFQNIPNSALTLQRPILLGRFDAGQGIMQQMTLSNDFTVNTTTGVIGLVTPNPPSLVDVGDLLTSTGSNNLVRLSLPSPNDGYLLMPYAAASSPACGLIWGEVGGDITYTVDDTIPSAPFGAFSIGANKVTFNKIQQLPAFTVIGNATGTNPATATALSKAELTTLVEQFNASASGAVPATGAAAGDSTKFLNAAGGWSPGGGGGGGTTTNALTIGSGLSPLATTFNGSAAVTISLNTGNANTWTALQTFENNIYVGVNSGAAGSVRFRGSTSGYVILQAPASPANQTYILPTATGATGQFLKLSDAGTGQLAWDTAGSGSGTVVSGAVNNLAYYSVSPTGTTVSALGSLGTSSQVLHGNASGIPTWGAVALASDVSGILPLANGGTNANLTAVAGAVAWSSGSAIGLTAAGSTGQILRSAGTSSPTWSTATYPATTVQGKILVSTANNVIGEIDAPTTNDTFLKWNAGVFSWAPASGGGGVTSVTLNLGSTGLLTSGATSETITASGSFDITGTLVVGNGGTGATTLTGLLRGTGTTAITGSAVVGLTSEVIGVLPVGNGGTGLGTNSAYAVVLGGTTNGGVLTQVASLGSAGQVLTSNGAGAAPTFQTGGGTVALNNVLGATGSSTRDNATSTIQWNWSSNTITNALVLNSTNITTGALLAVTHSNSAFTGTSGIVSFTSSAVTTGTILSVAHTGSSLTGNVASFTSTTVTTGAVLNLGISGTTATSAKNLVITNSSTANTSGRGIDVLISGNTASATTYGAFISNTKNGTAAYALYLNASGAATTNYGIAISATGGTTNYAIDVLAGISRFAAGTATVPQIVLSPSLLNGALTGTTNGSIWYDTTTASSNSSLYLYKDSLLTKFITLDRNPDFSGGATSGVVVSDSNGTLSKSADLTALGIFSVYANTGNITTHATETTMIGTSLVGSKTLPANFFAVGKTLRIFASGTIDNANNDATTIRFKLGATTIGTFSITGMHDTTTNDFVMEAYIICNASGANGTVRIGATFFVEGTIPSGEHTWYLPLDTQAGTINTTTSLAMDVTNQWGQPSCTMVVNFMTCYYIN